MFKTRKVIEKDIQLDEMRRVVTGISDGDKSTYAAGNNPNTNKGQRFIDKAKKRELYLDILLKFVWLNKSLIFKSEDPRLRRIYLTSTVNMVLDGYRCLSYFEFGDIKVKPDELFKVLKDREEYLSKLSDGRTVYVIKDYDSSISYDNWEEIVDYIADVKGGFSINHTPDGKGVSYTNPEYSYPQQIISLKDLGEEMYQYRKSKGEGRGS